MSGEGNCYEVAFHLMYRMSRGARLIHATVIGNGGEALGIRYGHAWVEEDGWAYDQSNGNNARIPVDRYRAVGQATDIREYDLSAMWRWVEQTEHYGPWEGEWVP